MPKAYIIAQIDVHNQEAYKDYTAHTPGLAAKHGGKFLVRAGRLEVLEGEVPPPRTVVIEFPSFDDAKAFYYSDSYQAILPIRLKNSTGRSFLVEGAE